MGMEVVFAELFTRQVKAVPNLLFSYANYYPNFVKTYTTKLCKNGVNHQQTGLVFLLSTLTDATRDADIYIERNVGAIDVSAIILRTEPASRNTLGGLNTLTTLIK